MRRWLLALLLVCAPLGALAENCTISATCTWSAVCTGCTFGGCTCDATDSFILASPAVVTIPSDGVSTDLDVSLTDVTGKVTVQSGATLTISQSGGLGLGGLGLLVESGGTFQAQGRALTYGNATPAFTATRLLADPTSPTTNTVLFAGEIVHCPAVGTGLGFGFEEDCEANNTISNCTGVDAPADCCTGAGTGTCTVPGSPQRIGICWPDADVAAQRRQGYQVVTGGQAGEGFYPEWLAQLAVGDVVVFWDPTESRSPPRDVNAMYEVLDLDRIANTRCLVLGVRQGTTQVSCLADPDARSCHLTERDVLEVTTSAAYTAGQRTISVGTTAVTADQQRASHSLDCPADHNGDGTAEAGARQIVALTEVIDDAGGDSLRLMPGGFPSGVPNGSSCYLSYGWARGDPLSAFRPALIGDGNAAVGTDSPIICARNSTCSMNMSLFNHLGQQLYIGPGITDLTNLWFREPGHVQLLELGDTVTGSRIQITSPNAAQSHGISSVGTNSRMTLSDLVLRHIGDDYILAGGCEINGAGTACTGGDDPNSLSHSLTLTRVRAEALGCAGGSCSLFDASVGAGPATFSATDVLFRDGEVLQTQFFFIDNLSGSDSVTVTNLTNLSGRSYMSAVGANSRSSYSNVYDVGRVTNPSVAIWDVKQLSDASLIETNSTVAGGYLIFPGTTFASTWERILALDFDTPAAGGPGRVIQVDHVGGNSVMRDIAVISPNRTGQAAGSTVINVQAITADTDRMDFERITVALRPHEQTTWGYAGLLWGVNAGEDSTFDSFRTLRDSLFAHYWSTTADLHAFDVDASDIDGLSRLCFHNNDIDTVNGANLPAGSLRETRGDFVAPELGNFTPRPSSPFFGKCGAVNAGARDMWALKVLHHQLSAADTWKPLGGGGGRTIGPRANP